MICPKHFKTFNLSFYLNIALVLRNQVKDIHLNWKDVEKNPRCLVKLGSKNKIIRHCRIWKSRHIIWKKS
jgi:hypothetical protein